MSSTRPFLIFDLDGALFGLDAMLVRESVWLPELVPIEEAPSYVVGMFSLRDRLIPVTDLNLRFGHPASPYSPDNQVVLLEQGQLVMGLIVNAVREVVDLPSSSIQPPPQFEDTPQSKASLIEAEARVGDDIVMLLDAHQLVRLPQDVTPTEHPAHHFCPEATPEQHAVYRERARALREAVADDEEDARFAFAALELGGEYFGIELGAVQEFCEVSRPSPIPCCPQHILGAINLRGNLLTLLDLRAALNLPRTEQCGSKAVISRFGNQTIGIAVDEVHDIVYLRQEELQPAPAALQEQHAAEIRNSVPFAGKMMLVLDLPALLAREEWIVNET